MRRIAVQRIGFDLGEEDAFEDFFVASAVTAGRLFDGNLDRKSTRLNSSHTDISRMPSSA